jgi:hypothetical protein
MGQSKMTAQIYSENLPRTRRRSSPGTGGAGVVILAGLSQPEEAEFGGCRNNRRSAIPVPGREILTVCALINLQRTRNNPGSETLGPDGVVSRADAHWSEIPTNPLVRFVIWAEIQVRSEIGNIR